MLVFLCSCGKEVTDEVTKENTAKMEIDNNVSTLIDDIAATIMSSNVETMKGWSFQYNSGTKDYSLFFGLCDENDNYVAADVSVAIRIENEYGEIVYNKTNWVTTKDFGAYSNTITGDRYLANVRIDEKDIVAGSSSSGTVYFTVKNINLIFDECNCTALYCLPVKDIELFVDSLPIELQKKGYNGKAESKVLITDVGYYVDNSWGYSTIGQ